MPLSRAFVDSSRVQTLGIVSPGAMGSAVADALARGGARVVASVEGRSERTVRLARTSAARAFPRPRRGGVRLPTSSSRSFRRRPRSAVAEDIARKARAARTNPLVVDLNAIAPETSRRLADVLGRAGCAFVDGSISGPPPWKADMTRIYLSGERASEAATLPITGVERIVVGSEVGSASAVKMSTASVYKGTSALLAHALLTAHTNGVLDHVLDDLRSGSPELIVNVAAQAGECRSEVRPLRQQRCARSRSHSRQPG